MKKIKNRSTAKCRSESILLYGHLEPRMMLSADLDVARNLVVNGDFETDGSTAFFSFADGDENNTQEITIVSVSTDRSNIAELDSVAGQIDSIAQDVITEADGEYILSFDLRGRPTVGGDDSATNDVELFFDGLSQGVFSGSSKWQTIHIKVTASSDLTRLEFREASVGSDGKGVLLDHICLVGVRESDFINGSFEDVDADISTGVVDSDDVPGFIALVDDGGARVIGIRAVADATDGNNILNLNTSDTRIDRIFQNVRTETGGKYFITFDFRNGDLSGTDSANLRLRWNGQFAGSFTGTTDWQRAGVVLEADDGFSTLLLREVTGQTGTGPQIDDIKIYKVDSQTSDYVLDLNGSDDGTDNDASHVENATTAVTAGDLSLTFANGNFLSSATARILGHTGTEQLSVNTDNTNITPEFDSNTGILRLVGRDQVSNYQRVLRSLTYNDSNEDPDAGTHRILVSVTDGTEISDRSEVALDVTPVNDAPVVTTIPDIPLPQNSPLTINVGAIDPDDTDLTFSIAVSGDTEIFGDELPTISDSGEIQLNAVTHGSADITVSVRDPGGLGSDFTFNVNVAFEAPTAVIPDDFAPFSGQRQLTNTLPSLREDIYDSAPAMTIDTSLNFRAVIETSDGDIVFELFAAESPITVNNFINLAEDGYFDGLTFHRVIDDFVAQGGDPAGTGGGGPGYQFVDELLNGLDFNRFGQLAMANSGSNTNGSQFFFTLNDNPAFSGQHTIFGQLIEGEDVLRAVNLTTGSETPQVIQRVRIETV